MSILNQITLSLPELMEWRQYLHSIPEIAFQEVKTAAFLVDKLKSFGLDIHQGLAKTGIVATLKSGDGHKSIALRADMDALAMSEKNTLVYCSQHDKQMHACGHDGHSTMLLGAAQYLAATKNFNGIVYFIFQPAEENEGGANIMIQQGLFDQFPADAIYGMHNWPGLDVGQFAIRSGAMMAAFNTFEIRIEGSGAHAAMPHLSKDPIVIAAHIITALQTIASRQISPLEPVVVSITQIQGGQTWNVIPDHVMIKGTTRMFTEELQNLVEHSLKQIVTSLCEAYGAKAEIHYQRRYPATINSDKETEYAISAAEQLVTEANVIQNFEPSMGAEDFSFMLQHKPGSYIRIGNGSNQNGCVLHSPKYDFNDEILALGASYWAQLAEMQLPING